MVILFYLPPHRKETSIKTTEHSTVKEAYRYYLKHYVTFKEKLYYKSICGESLRKVKDEEIMEEIFRNVFDNACILIRP